LKRRFDIWFKKGNVSNEKTNRMIVVNDKIVNTIDFSVFISFLSDSHLTKAVDKLSDNIVVSNNEVVSSIPRIPKSEVGKTDV